MKKYITLYEMFWKNWIFKFLSLISKGKIHEGLKILTSSYAERQAIKHAVSWFWGDLCHALWLQSNTWTGQNAWHESPEKRRNALKMVISTKESKIVYKSKVDRLKMLPTRICLFYDFLHFKGCPYINHKISLRYDLYFEHFFGFS